MASSTFNRARAALLAGASIGLITACSASSTPDTGSDDNVGSSQAAIGSSQMVWNPQAPTAKVTLHPGENSATKTQSGAGDLNTAFQVQVDAPGGGFSGGIEIRGPVGATSARTCALYSLSARVSAWNGTKWTDAALLPSQDVSGTWMKAGGEFPTYFCNLMLSYENKDPKVTSIRVMAQSREPIFFQGFTGSLATNVTVDVGGELPIPDPGKKIKIVGVDMSPDGVSTTQWVENVEGPNVATWMRATVHAYYKYCDADYCTLDSMDHGCYEHFCAPGSAAGPGWPVEPKHCEVEYSTSLLNIAPFTQTAHTWETPYQADDCPPCIEADGLRCADLTLVLSTKTTMPKESWETWDVDTKTVTHLGIVGEPSPTN
jgi:hypothetical protein